MPTYQLRTDPSETCEAHESDRLPGCPIYMTVREVDKNSGQPYTYQVPLHRFFQLWTQATGAIRSAPPP